MGGGGGGGVGGRTHTHFCNFISAPPAAYRTRTAGTMGWVRAKSKTNSIAIAWEGVHLAIMVVQIFHTMID